MKLVLKQIFGHGIDVTNSKRVISVYNRQGTRFLQKMMHANEIAHFEQLITDNKQQYAEQFIASRWALKEAVIKATGARLLFPEMYLAKSSSLVGMSLLTSIQRKNSSNSINRNETKLDIFFLYFRSIYVLQTPAHSYILKEKP